jgi:dTDP-4-dehydrorhamnose reductase
MKILVTGANGMIGSAIYTHLRLHGSFDVYGSVRCRNRIIQLPSKLHSHLIISGDLQNNDNLSIIFDKIRPNVVINCVGLTKHLPEGNIPLPAITINSLLPHMINNFCNKYNARMIHISTDCVFSGLKGSYNESDLPDASDIYGKSKCLGEVSDRNSLTLRTSTIGHEINSSYGLLEWFLKQDQCKGFSNAYFSGLTTLELARVIRDYVIPDSRLAGLYHLGGARIDKYSLLHLISSVYNKKIVITDDDSFQIDRSLNSSRFYAETNYIAPMWSEMIRNMYSYQFSQG